MLTTFTKQALLAASLVVMWGIAGLSGKALAEEQAPTIEALFVALSEGQWAAAEKIAGALDANAEDKTLFSTFTRATQLVANNDCASGEPLAATVVSRSPLFLPAYDLIAKCLVDAGETGKAADLFDNVALQLNKGAERDQILARAQALRPDLSPKFSADFNIQPSTNVNRGTDNETIGGWTIADAARTKAGVVASVHAAVDKPLYISKHLIAGVSLRVGAHYEALSEQIYPSARLALASRFLLSSQTSIGATLSYEHVHKGTAFESGSPSVAVDVAHHVSQFLVVGGGAAVSYTHHQNDAYTGWTARLHANAGMIVSANDRLSVAASYVLEARHSDAQSYNQFGFATEWEHAFQNGAIGSFGGEASYRLYRSDAPLTSEKQHNIQVKATIGFSHRDFMIGKFRPELAYTFTKQWSNDAFSDFAAHDVSVRAKAAF